MKRSLLTVLAMLLLAAAGLAQDDWQGSYLFEEDGGRTAGGTGIFITHELNIFDTDDGLRATLKSNGYQTSKDLNCTAKANGGKLQIFFDNYGEDNVFESYKAGELLLTLELRKAKRGKTELLTWWGTFQPIVPEKPKTGKVFFVKADSGMSE